MMPQVRCWVRSVPRCTAGSTWRLQLSKHSKAGKLAAAQIAERNGAQDGWRSRVSSSDVGPQFASRETDICVPGTLPVASAAAEFLGGAQLTARQRLLQDRERQGA